MEEEGGVDFTNLFLLAECACKGQQSSALVCKKPPSSSPTGLFLHPSSSSLPNKRIRTSTPSAPQVQIFVEGNSSKRACDSSLPSPLPWKSLHELIPNGPQTQGLMKNLVVEKACCTAFPSPLLFTIHDHESPPFSFLPYKKLCGPGPLIRRQRDDEEGKSSSNVGPPPPSSLPYKKLRGPCQPPPGWLEAHLRLKGTKPMWFGNKLLTSTDVGAHFNRLALPKEVVTQILSSTVMTEKEKSKATLPERGLPVMVLDRMGRTWKLVLKYWSSCKAQVLHGEWNDLVKKNKLQANIDCIDFWAFRANGPNGPLWFALV